jgi:hypothetical protein
MTITITIPAPILHGGLAGTMRSLLPLVEPVALAIAGACGAGILLQVGLDIGFKLARHALQDQGGDDRR